MILDIGWHAEAAASGGHPLRLRARAPPRACSCRTCRRDGQRFHCVHLKVDVAELCRIEQEADAVRRLHPVLLNVRGIRLPLLVGPVVAASRRRTLSAASAIATVTVSGASCDSHQCASHSSSSSDGSGSEDGGATGCGETIAGSSVPSSSQALLMAATSASASVGRASAAPGSVQCTRRVTCPSGSASLYVTPKWLGFLLFGIFSVGLVLTDFTPGTALSAAVSWSASARGSWHSGLGSGGVLMPGANEDYAEDYAGEYYAIVFHGRNREVLRLYREVLFLVSRELSNAVSTVA